MNSVIDLPTNASIYDDRLNDFCRQFGSNFEDFTSMEKYDILAAIGLWGGYCAEGNSISLAGYIQSFLPGMAESDGKDMLIALSNEFSYPGDAMSLVLAIANQIREGFYLDRPI